MFITILDYSRSSLTVINDEENVIKATSNENIELILDALGFHDSEISYMTSENNPYESTTACVTLNELLQDVDEDIIDLINRQLNVSAESGSENENESKG